MLNAQPPCMYRLKSNPTRFVMFLFEEPQPHSEPLIVYYDMRDRERNKRGKTEFNRKFEKVKQ
jgi:hypothetical protein